MRDKVQQLCLLAFTEIFSSISHELKNSLAIINENAGLLDDFVLMSAESGSVESFRVQKATAAIEKQVTRSDKIIKNMNHFAHTTDIPKGIINIHDTLYLLTEMTNRKAAAKELVLEIVGEKEQNVETEIVVLETLLYCVLSIFYQTATGTGAKQLKIKTTSDEQKTRIAFIAEDFSFTVPQERDSALALIVQHLGCKAEINTSQIDIILNR